MTWDEVLQLNRDTIESERQIKSLIRSNARIAVDRLEYAEVLPRVLDGLKRELQYWNMTTHKWKP